MNNNFQNNMQFNNNGYTQYGAPQISQANLSLLQQSGKTSQPAQTVSAQGQAAKVKNAQGQAAKVKNAPTPPQKPNNDKVELSTKNKTKPKKGFIQKVKEYFDGNTKEGQTRRKIAIAAGVAITGTAVYFLTHGRKGTNPLTGPKPGPRGPVTGTGKPPVPQGRKYMHNFSHDAFVKPTSNAQLDREAQNIINGVTLDKAFNDTITSEADLRAVITRIFPDSTSWDTNNFVSSYRKDANAAEMLRYLTPSNFGGDTIGSYKAYSLITAAEDNGAIDINAFKDFLKLKKKYDTNLYKTSNIVNEYKNYLKNPKETKRFYAYADLANKQLNGNTSTFIRNPINAFRISNKEHFDAKATMEFLSTLKKGNVDDDLWKLNNLLENDDFDPKKGVKFLKSLKKDVMEHIGLKTIEGVTTTADINGKDFSKKLNKLSSDVLVKLNFDTDMLSFAKFADLYGVDSINALNMAQKKDLISRLVKNNSNSFTNESSEMFPLIPKNQEEYCNLLAKLSRSIGIDTKPLTKAERTAFNEGLNKLSNSIKNINLDDVDVTLDMPRDKFISRVKDAIEDLDDVEKRKVMDYFGFELADVTIKEKGKADEIITTLKGYPINVNNGAKLKEIANQETKDAVEVVRKIVKDFSETNKITLVSKDGTALSNAQAAFEDDLNAVLQGLPELKSIIGRKQHVTHVYTLDEHTLRVFKNVVSDPEFAKLSKKDKKVLSMASLLHDITKAERMRDYAHPAESAFDAYYITEKFKLPEDERLKVYELIRSHNWLDRMNAKINKGKSPLPPEQLEAIAQDVAFDARHTNTFELAKILCKADMKGVQPNDRFYNKHKDAFDTMSGKVDKYLERIHSSQILLPQTQILRASKVKNGVQKTADGIKNTVIYMDTATDDLSRYGFAPGTKKENLRALVHALEREEQMSKFDTFSMIDTEALLSTSYIDAKHFRVFRDHGFILNVNSNDIHAGYYRDFGTGYGKDIELLKADYLFMNQRVDNKVSKQAWRGNRTEYRDYISGIIKKAMGTTDNFGQPVPISDKEYMNLMKKIQNCKSITDIEKVDANFAKKLNELFDNMFRYMETHSTRRGNRQYNEMLVTRPKIQGVFAYDEKYEKIPKFLRKYAEDNDIPIIIFGNGT